VELFKVSLPAEKGLDILRLDISSTEKWGVQISLAPLTHQAMRESAMELFQRAVDVPEQIIELLVERSEGVPYFTEEMVNWFIDHGILDTCGEQWCFQPD